jgi:phosphate transport system substrate-binding protein
MNRESKRGISKILLTLCAVAIVVAAGIAYTSLNKPSEAPASLTAGGASFPYPIITKWTSEYNKLHPGIQITYQSIGSGGGQRNLFSKTFDFAGSDAPLTDAQMANYSGIVHVPETCGGVVVSYNIPGIGKGLNLSANVVAAIFLGNITKWNDPAIASINPNVSMPNADIVVVHRSDSSGTSFVFTDFLSNASSQWAALLGKGTTVNWPVGIGSPQNSGVASSIIQTPYSIGYLEFFYAKNNSIAYANIQNQNGKFVEPTLQTISNAAKAGASRLSADIRASIVNIPGDDVYPISSFTYILVYKDLSYMDQAKAQAIANFLYWVIHDGQSYSESLLYPRLPNDIVILGDSVLRQLTYGGNPLL